MNNWYGTSYLVHRRSEEEYRLQILSDSMDVCIPQIEARDIMSIQD